jgi:zinc protease
MSETALPLLDLVREHRLNNGIRIFLCPMPGVRTVSCNVCVNTGSANEGADLGSGLSHFLEHMMFGGTKSFPGHTEIADRVNARGGSLNAFTSQDQTFYYINLPAADAVEGVRMLASMMREPLFPEDEFSREKDVILNESRMRLDSPRLSVYENMLGELFRGSPYRVPIIGYDHLLKSVTREQMMAYHRRRYTPERMAFYIAGRFDADAVLAELRSKLEDWQPDSFREDVPARPFARSGRHTVDLTWKDSLAFLAFGWQLHDLTPRENAALRVLAFLFDDESGRVYRAMHIENALIADSWADYVMFQDGQGFFFTAFEGDPAKMDAMQAGFHDVLRDFRGRPVTKREIARARAAVEAEILSRFETPSDFAGLISGSVRMNGSCDLNVILRELDAVTPDDVAEILRTMLAPDDVTCVRMAPEDAGKAKKASCGKYAPALPRPVVETAKTGQTMLLLEDPTRTMAEITLVLPCAVAFESASESMFSRLVSEAIFCGAGKYDEAELAEILADYAIAADCTAGNNSMFLTLQFPRKSFRRAVRLAATIATEPAFPAEAVEREKTNLIRELESQMLQPDTVAFARLKELVLGADHPYGRRPETSLAALEKASAAKLRDFYRNRALSAKSACLAFSGAISAKQARAAAQEVFSAGRWNAPAPKRPAPPKPTRPTNLAAALEQRNQAVVTCGFRSCGVETSDLVWDLVLNAENGMSSKLFKTVRGEKGLAYWTGFLRSYGFGVGLSAFAASTSDDHVFEVRTMLLDEFRRLATNGLDKDEFDAALAARKYAFDAATSGSLAKQAALEHYLIGDALQPWTRREQLDKLTRAELNRRLKRDLKGVELYSVIAHPRIEKKAVKKAAKKR